MLRLKDKAAIIAGGGAGIGHACCDRFSAEGAKVVVAAINETTGRAVTDTINARGGDAFFVRCDVASEPDVAAATEAAFQ